jgi:formate-dependent nitrite reductase membrane component NrfD
MSTPGEAQNTYGRWPDEDDRFGGKRAGRQGAAMLRSAGDALRSRSSWRRREGGERAVVPPAEFTSYYGLPVVKPSPWENDIPAYFFFGGLAAGSSLLAAGADLTGRAALRRSSRVGALGAIGLSTFFLINDLGKPSRFVNMLRVVRLTSPMSVGSWILAAYGPMAGVAAISEVAGPLLPGRFGRLVSALARPAGLGAALFAPPLATYTAVLASDTATPAWHSAYRELPTVFGGSAAAASGGLGLMAAPVAQAGPARRMAVGGAVVDLVAAQRMERSMGLAAETLHTGRAHTLLRLSQGLTVAGALGAAVLGRRSRIAAALSGAALMAGSACTRFAVFEAGQASAKDPKYTVVPQRERLQQAEQAAHFS